MGHVLQTVPFRQSARASICDLVAHIQLTIGRYPPCSLNIYEWAQGISKGDVIIAYVGPHVIIAIDVGQEHLEWIIRILLNGAVEIGLLTLRGHVPKTEELLVDWDARPVIIHCIWVIIG